MNAEALIGRAMGGCLLQHVAGSGTMGIVYRATQSQPARFVAVKVMTRATSLELSYQIKFLESFRGIVAQSAALHHPHIVKIFEYGDDDGMAYLVMPCIQALTLEELLTGKGALPLDQSLSYLDQLARALDYAHTRGIVHRDLKPANCFVTPEESLLVADFQLTKVLTEGSIAQMRLSQPGMLDYMSPELVIGKEVDGRADIYSLGAIVYRMVTGVAPFQGQTLMKVATKHLKMPPPSPRTLCPDLPPAAEQVILKALAKSPADRYESALDFAMLFRQALRDVATPLSVPRVSTPPQSQARFPGSSGSSSMHQASNQMNTQTSKRPGVIHPPVTPPGTIRSAWNTMNGGSAGAVTALPVDVAPTDSSTTGSLSLRRRVFITDSARHPALATDPRIQLEETDQVNTEPQGSNSVIMSEPITPVAPSTSTTPVASIAPIAPVTPAAPQTQLVPEERVIPPRLLHNALENHNLTGALPNLGSPPESSDKSGTWKLEGPAKIVSIPVAGQPGQFVTGILPTQPLRQSQDTPLPALSLSQRIARWRKEATLVLLALILVIGSLSLWFAHNATQHSANQANQGSAITATPNLPASATAKAIGTLEANTILYDPLTQNIRDWPVVNNGSILYQFSKAGYSITNNDPSRIAPAILEGEDLNQPFGYTLTMQELHGDDTSVNNEFGLIVRFNSQSKNGKQVVMFYSFEVLNKAGGEYQFWKYDNSAGSSSDPWNELAKRPFGAEFHQGHGPKSINTIKILVNGANFTLFVNGKQVWKVSDHSFSRGGVGMLVNLKGTEVAFSDLRLTNN